MKVAIIGGGICGLYLAWKLSKKGHKVTVFERKERIGKEICSGLISQRILNFIPESKKLIQNQINFTLLHFPKKTVKIRFSKPFFVISHFELDKLTAALAQKAGAEILLNNNISSLPKGFDKVIGCDGANSLVRKELGLPDPFFRLAIQGFVKREDFSDFVETWACQNGFVWKIPRGKEIEYGILAKPESARKIFKDFLKKESLILERIKAKLVPQGFVIPSNPAVTLCGDAAGLTKPWSGGGVIWGLTGASFLLQSFPGFLKYKRLMKKFFLPRIILSKNTTKLVYFLGFKFSWLLPKNNKMESDFLI